MAGVGTGMAAAFPEVVDLSDTVRFAEAAIVPAFLPRELTLPCQALEDPGEVDALDEAVESVNLAVSVSATSSDPM